LPLSALLAPSPVTAVSDTGKVLKTLFGFPMAEAARRHAEQDLVLAVILARTLELWSLQVAPAAAKRAGFCVPDSEPATTA
jgi:hypothetical protein